MCYLHYHLTSQELGGGAHNACPLRSALLRREMVFDPWFYAADWSNTESLPELMHWTQQTPV